MNMVLLPIYGLNAQSTVYNVDKQFSFAELHNDWRILVHTVLDVHPSATRYIDSTELIAVADSLELSIVDSMTESEFHLLVREWIREIGCGHLTAKPSTGWYTFQKSAQKILPMEVLVSENDLFVHKVGKYDSLMPAGSQILAIDNHTSAEILSSIRKIQQRDGYGTVFEDFQIEKLFRTYYTFVYGLNDGYSVVFKKETGDIDTLLIYPSDSKIKEVAKTDQSKSDLPEFSNVQLYFPEQLANTAVLDIDAFSRGNFKKYYKDVFALLEEQKVDNLIIDVRGNGGGYFPHGNYLLRYVLPNDFNFEFNRPDHQPDQSEYLRMTFISRMTKNLFALIPDQERGNGFRDYTIHYNVKSRHHFDGKIYVLTNGGSFSLSSYVAARLKHHAHAFVAGEETGGAEYGSNAVISYNLTLPATGVEVIIPYYFLSHSLETQVNGRGVQPDLSITTTWQDKMLGKDPCMAAVIEHIGY